MLILLNLLMYYLTIFDFDMIESVDLNQIIDHFNIINCFIIIYTNQFIIIYLNLFIKLIVDFTDIYFTILRFFDLNNFQIKIFLIRVSLCILYLSIFLD